tara:strand:+ start:1043 stop:2257 length:1215 start_codon:yes stop_codon:yes gene_type:complete
MADLIGFTLITLVSLLTFFLALRRKIFSKILFVALVARITVLILGHYFITLPDSTADAETFERVAWSLSQEGFFSLMSNYQGPSARFISWFIAIPYSLFGRSILMAKSISLLFGMGSVFLGCLLAEKLWDKRTSVKIGWTIALFPSLILYSALVMREAYMVFFILIALHGVVNWTKKNNINSIILALAGFAGGVFFHGAILVGAICFAGIVGFSILKKIIKQLINLRFHLQSFLIMIIVILISGYYFTSKLNVPYLGNFESATNIDNLLKKTQNATRGDAAWPEWTKINNPMELIYKSPIRSIYVVFAPFPWDVKKTKHLIGMFDAFIYFYLTILILQNLKIIWYNPALRIILLILLTYLFVFGIGVGNFGTGIRHRAKFAILFILLAGPLLKRFIILKKVIRN